MKTAHRRPTNQNADASDAAGLIAAVHQLVSDQQQSLSLVIRDVLRTIMRFPAAAAVSYFERDEALGFRPATPLICRKNVAHLAGNWGTVANENGRPNGAFWTSVQRDDR